VALLLQRFSPRRRNHDRSAASPIGLHRSLGSPAARFYRHRRPAPMARARASNGSPSPLTMRAGGAPRLRRGSARPAWAPCDHRLAPSVSRNSAWRTALPPLARSRGGPCTPWRRRCRRTAAESSPSRRCTRSRPHRIAARSVASLPQRAAREGLPSLLGEGQPSALGVWRVVSSPPCSKAARRKREPRPRPSQEPLPARSRCGDAWRDAHSLDGPCRPIGRRGNIRRQGGVTDND